MRLGINIPDDLIKRMDPIRPYTNISKICKDAISRHVESFERAKNQAENDGMQNVAEQIFQKQKLVIVDWEVFGLEDAKKWAELASNDDWDLIFDRLDVFERQGKSPFEVEFPVPRVKGASTYYDQQYKYDGTDSWFDQQIKLDSKGNPYITAKLEYQRGFISYILVVRQMMTEKAKADLKDQTIKLKNLKSDLKSKIEIPERLAKEY